MLVGNGWTILMMGGGAAEMEELMRPLWCRDFFFQPSSRVGLNVNDVTFSSLSARQSYQATEASQSTLCG